LLPWDTGFQDRVCDGDQPAGDGDNDELVRLAAHFEVLRDRGTVGDAYDSALAECIIGLFKTEVINQIGPWKSMRDVEWEALKWVDWYNNPSQVHSNLWRSPARPSRSYRLRPTRRSRGGVLCKPEHARYGRLAVEQITLR
jgi:hypothetical protein